MCKSLDVDKNLSKEVKKREYNLLSRNFLPVYTNRADGKNYHQSDKKLHVFAKSIFYLKPVEQKNIILYAYCIYLQACILTQTYEKCESL